MTTFLSYPISSKYFSGTESATPPSKSLIPSISTICSTIGMAHEALIHSRNVLKSGENRIEEVISEKENIYQIDYYREDIFNLLNKINQALPLEEIPDFIKRAFALDETVFSENFYFKGIFPKILVSKNINENDKITGICSFHYERSRLVCMVG